VPSKLNVREKTKQALYVWRRLFPYLGAYRGRLFAAFSLTTIVVLAELAKPWPLKVVIDQVLGDEPWAILPESMTGKENAGSLALLAGAAVLVFSIITGFASYFRDLWLAETGQKVVNRIRRHALDRMLLMSLRWHEQRRQEGWGRGREREARPRHAGGEAGAVEQCEAGAQGHPARQEGHSDFTSRWARMHSSASPKLKGSMPRSSRREMLSGALLVCKVDNTR
jgi:ABC-type multidrug transport system fused ATPase/permease subunit